MATTHLIPESEVLEESSQVGVVGLVGEAEGAAILEVDAEFVGEAAREEGDVPQMTAVLRRRCRDDLIQA